MRSHYMTVGLGSCGVAVVDTLGGLSRESGIRGRDRATDRSATVAPPRRGFFATLLDAMHETQRLQAERQIPEHRRMTDEIEAAKMWAGLFGAH